MNENLGNDEREEKVASKKYFSERAAYQLEALDELDFEISIKEYHDMYEEALYYINDEWLWDDGD